MARFINPFSDWGFKRIFGQEMTKDLLTAFLNDLFAGEFEISSLRLNNKEHLGLSTEERGIIFDIYCTTSEGKHFIVEMQNRSQAHFVDRSIYYTSRAIIDQGKKGVWDYKLMPVYTICFMNFNETGDKCQKFRTDMVLADRETGECLSENLRIVYLRLPLFTKEEDECTNNFERWIYVLKHMNTFERMPFLAQNAVFRKLAEISDLNTLSSKERVKYDKSIQTMRDAYATYQHALEKGVANGTMKIAKAMLSAGEPLSKISLYTGLSEEEIMKL